MGGASCCDLEVDVNGEATFMVNKNVLSSFSSKCSNLFGNFKGKNEVLKVIFNDFPGGAHGFELILRFCYSSTKKLVITPSNIVLLYCAAHFMEMHYDGPSGTTNLITQIEKFLEEGIHLWTWFELLEALRQCQECSISSKSYSTILDRIVDHLIERLVILPSISSPYTSSSNRSSFQFSCETSSNSSWRNNCSGPSWWFEHLLFLKAVLPDVARESHDQLYLAMDIYLKVHAGLTDKEKMSICCALNHEKLSSELLRNLTRNLVFPAEAKPRSQAHTQSRIKHLLQENDHLKYFLDSVFGKSFKNTDAKEDGEELKPKEDLQVMQGMMKSGSQIMNNARFLPKLCSR
ncbi:hypothetical protein K1719_016601 [Acacia pycnantha]|nr:hypothetical protein K1719_040860 [Acacia pycnantha]KAI9112404.1 hypothetical protein K1719_016601 [Acacia pycnantha]